jgi:hypothetical protein
MLNAQQEVARNLSSRGDSKDFFVILIAGSEILQVRSGAAKLQCI